jgi:hypothetical protein
LQKRRQENVASFALRDSYRNEVNKYTYIYKEKRGNFLTILFLIVDISAIDVEIANLPPFFFFLLSFHNALNFPKTEQIDQRLAEIEKLNNSLNAAEEEMILLKKAYEQVTKQRNSAGILLLDRNDELCVLYEKINAQESVIKQGELELVEKKEVRVEITLPPDPSATFSTKGL